MTKVTMAVVAWWQAAIQHHHGSIKWTWLPKKEKVNNQREMVVMEKVTLAVVVWWRLPCSSM